MELNKRQVLDLIKVLSHYEVLGRELTLVDVDVNGLCSDLEDVLLGEDDEEGSDYGPGCDHGSCEECETDEEGEEAGEEPADEEDEEESCLEEDDEGDEADDEGEGSDEAADECPACDGDVDGDRLHDLKPIRGKVISSTSATGGESVELEFECVAPGAVDVLLDAMPITIQCLKRTGKELHFLDDSGSWHEFSVSKFPKDWQRVLPAGDRLRIA